MNDKKQRFRVWNIVNVPNHPTYSDEFDNIEDAVGCMNDWADVQLRSARITSNAFGIEVRVVGEWEEADEWEYGYDSHWEKEPSVVTPNENE